MHRSLLERYFDIGPWHRDLFIALLEYKSTWTWQELSDVFMQVCCHLKTPRGSASARPDWINHMNRLGWCSIECVKGEQDASKILVHHRVPAVGKRPRGSRILLRAVRWSMDHAKLENEWREKISTATREATEYADRPDSKHEETMRLLAVVHSLREQSKKVLKAHRSKFRLAG